MVMSLILLAPSWGGMINGMMTLSGAWHKLRTDPILRFLVVSLSFYGMSHLRRPDDVDQDRKRPVTQHRLDHWPRSRRRAGLGCHGSIGALYHLIPLIMAANTAKCTPPAL